jgi:hypothetical protein
LLEIIGKQSVLEKRKARLSGLFLGGPEGT